LPYYFLHHTIGTLYANRWLLNIFFLLFFLVTSPMTNSTSLFHFYAQQYYRKGIIKINKIRSQKNTFCEWL
jgi:hypothetical protein